MLFAGLFLAVSAYAATVQLGNTTVTGRDIPGLGQEFFGGLPFAQPPLGSLRFKPPIQKTSLGDLQTFDASNFGLQCVQASGPLSATKPFPVGEDCLTVNIFRPANISSSARLPVMVWIYGGGFTTGSGAVYNGSSIVSHASSRGTPIVYVNFNYRLGPFGFPQGAEAAAKGALNLGLKDQIAALKWIQANIAAFGGDPAKVTLFGESAGAISIGVHYLNSHLLPKLARGAIFQSGSASTTFTFDGCHRQRLWSNLVGAVPECAHLANNTKANTFDCLRNVSADTIFTAFDQTQAAANEEFPWVPVIDGKDGLVPDYPSRLISQGKFARIPFIAGTNLDEGTILSLRTIESEETIRQWIITNHTASPADIPALNRVADRLLKLYPDIPALGSPFGTGNETFGLSSQYKRLAALMGDLFFQSTRRSWIQHATKNGVKAYGYLFTDPPPAILNDSSNGVQHGLDVLYVYPGLVPGLGLEEGAKQLSDTILDYWISFAVNLDPNSGWAERTWKEYKPHEQVLLQLHRDNVTTIPDNYRAKQIAYINAHSVLLRQ